MSVEQHWLQAENQPAENPSFQLSGARLLIVDDNLDIRTLFAFILEDQGAEVVAVTSVAEALEVIKQTKLDLLISDINLEGENGYSLIQKVRTLTAAQGGQTPAIAVTGNAVDPDPTASGEAFQLHLTKPVDPDDLVKAAVRLIKK